MYKRYKRSGQFFIISVIILIITIYSIKIILDETGLIDASELQKDDSIWRINNLEKNIKDTIKYSTTNEIENNIKFLILRDQEILKNKATISYTYTYYNQTKDIKIEINYNTQNKRYKKIIETNEECQKAHPNQNLCTQLLNQQRCCTKFNLCC
jgi:hypothetical protein